MGAAVGFAAIVIVAAIFMPAVLHGLETFLLTLLDRATAVVGSIDVEQSATIFRTLR
jgi:hypothetical protein